MERCPVCSSDQIQFFFDIDRVPVFCNVLHSSKQKARKAAKGSIHLGFCRECAHIYNYHFDPKQLEYSPAYENSLFYSTKYTGYSRGLAQRLINEYDIRNKTVMDVGCGQGEFLEMLCSLGQNNGIGFDPGYRGKLENGRIRFIRDYFSKRYSRIKADLIVSRHVLEHIPDPVGFLRMLKASLQSKESSLLFTEVPNALFTLRDLGIWDIIYEHCSYFTPSSLLHLYSNVGLNPGMLEETYNGQFLCIEADLRGGSVQFENESVEPLIASFQEAFRAKKEQWQDYVAELSKTSRKVVLWGAGSKGVMFLNLLNIAEEIPFVVDINPGKAGKFIPVTGQKVVQPSFLKTYQPDILLILNPIYIEEIQELVRRLGIHPSLITV